MCGADSLRESDQYPIHLCPVDLHKLQYVLKFDIMERYQKLLEFYKEVKGFDDEVQWIIKRISKISNSNQNINREHKTGRLRIIICKESNQKMEKVLMIDYSYQFENVLYLAGKKLGKQNPKGLYFANTKVQSLQNLNQGDKLILI